ncbi:hypothetical protein LNV23_07955 [Paucibacter sp. DJ1R-11]|uniref:hypothetical protein n=1 Tax=Paucibacter sp. DJ1R-11 TaxID=2893556 RepID=UPI0021E38AC1|nr:hypothetical protein [Paucibacter sp. DJ1R-11]MCV2363381.1 hypothetical protein [Paucibacter sp. DJ1R-11]
MSIINSSGPQRLVIDQLTLSLSGVSDADGRLLASELEPALRAALQSAPPLARPIKAKPPTSLMQTALRGPALVDAVAAQLADLIASKVAAQASQASEANEENPSWR